MASSAWRWTRRRPERWPRVSGCRRGGQDGKRTLVSDVGSNSVQDRLVLVVASDEPILAELDDVLQRRMLELLERHAAGDDVGQDPAARLTDEPEDSLPDVVGGWGDASVLLLRLAELLLALLLHDARPGILVLVRNGLGEHSLEVCAVVHLEDREHSSLRLVEECLATSLGVCVAKSARSSRGKRSADVPSFAWTRVIKVRGTSSARARTSSGLVAMGTPPSSLMILRKGS